MVLHDLIDVFIVSIIIHSYLNFNFVTISIVSTITVINLFVAAVNSIVLHAVVVILITICLIVANLIKLPFTIDTTNNNISSYITLTISIVVSHLLYIVLFACVIIFCTYCSQLKNIT